MPDQPKIPHAKCVLPVAVLSEREVRQMEQLARQQLEHRVAALERTVAALLKDKAR